MNFETTRFAGDHRGTESWLRRSTSPRLSTLIPRRSKWLRRRFALPDNVPPALKKFEYKTSVSRCLRGKKFNHRGPGFWRFRMSWVVLGLVVMKNEEPIHQPHDKLFKTTFSQLENSRQFMCHYLPERLVASCDWMTLCLQPGSFIDSQFRLSESDLLFSVNSATGRALIHVLFEHQRKNDPDLMFRLHRYQSRIWDTH